MQRADFSITKRPLFRLVSAGLIFTVLAVMGLGWYVFNSYKTNQSYRSILRIEKLRGNIIHLDEVLTVSARMAALTADPKWDRRYHFSAPKLDYVIQEAKKMVSSPFSRSAIEKIDQANIVLVEMQERSFEWVKEGRLEEAQALLFGEDYEHQKKKYILGIKELTDFLGDWVEFHLERNDQKTIAAMAAVMVAVFVLLVVWVVLMELVRSWQKNLLEKHAQLVSKAGELDALNRGLDQKVNERTKKIENMQLATLNLLEDMEKEIAERKQAQEKAMEAMNIKSEFTSIVSHELRTPLSIIKESVNLVVEEVAGPVTPGQRTILETAKRNLDRLTRLVNDVLDFQKLESGFVEFKMAPYDLNQLVHETVEGFKLVAKNKGLQMGEKLHQGIPKIVFDRDKITQVLSNLVNNAIKFSNQGTITLQTDYEGPGAVRVSVRDQGLGIKEEHLPKLFQSFSQILDEEGPKREGTGLGLAISKTILKAHQGRMGVESVYGQGSNFYFVLPITEIKTVN